MAADAGSTTVDLIGANVRDNASTSAADRLSRFIARFTSAGAAAYLVLLIPQMVSQSALLKPWYTPIFVVAIFAPAFLLWFASFRCTMAHLRAVVTVMALGYLLAQLLWLPAFDGPLLAGSSSTWISVFPGLITLATGIAWSNRTVLAYLLVVASLGQVINYYSRDGHGNVPLFSDIVFGVMFCGIFTVTVMLVIRTGRVLDATRASAEAQAAATAASTARSVERERFDALIHDDVMSTLLAASRTGNSASLTRQAQVAVARLERLRSGLGDAEPMTASSFEAYLRSALTKVDENIRVEGAGSTASETPRIPMEAARALSASAAEALRNSVRHATGAHRTVSLTVGAASTSVVVSDDGPGFDPSRIPSHRLGLAVSIRGRMRQVSGGWASVRSSPGLGTEVTLGWSGGDTAS